MALLNAALLSVFCSIPFIVDAAVLINVVADVNVYCHVVFVIPFIVDVVIPIFMVVGAHVCRLGLS